MDEGSIKRVAVWYSISCFLIVMQTSYFVKDLLGVWHHLEETIKLLARVFGAVAQFWTFLPWPHFLISQILQ